MLLMWSVMLCFLFLQLELEQQIAEREAARQAAKAAAAAREAADEAARAAAPPPWDPAAKANRYVRVFNFCSALATRLRVALACVYVRLRCEQQSASSCHGVNVSGMTRL
jgi:hypothetical protein